MANILGISIGTRNVGIAVIRLRKLTDYRIRTFPGKWTKTKSGNILSVLETVIDRDKITDIVFKIPAHTHCSENLEELIRGIVRLGKERNIEAHNCTINEIKISLVGTPHFSKKIMIAALVEKYPELRKEWHKSERAQVYDAKLFEAIACAELALRAGH